MKKIISALIIILSTPMLIHARGGLSGINQWLDSQMQSNANTPVFYLLLLLGGFLASLLPCTYPLYPITVRIVSGRSGGKSKYAHPLAYYIGIIIIYFIFGVIASLTGGAFNDILRLPVSNLIIGVLIFLLGLSTIDLLMIPLFAGAVGEPRSKSLVGTFTMGMGAGLLTSACVGPIVVTILLSIASSSTSISLSMTLSSAVKMMLFGMGIGIPFFLLGVAGASLPKAGKWMKWVQYFFAIVILYFSWFFIEKSLLGFGFSYQNSIVVFIASLIVILAVFGVQKREVLPHDRMRSSLLIFAALMATIVLFTRFMPSSTVANEPGLAQNPVLEQKGSLTWYLDKKEAYDEATRTGKNVFIDFHANWCSNCKAFQKQTQENEVFNKALQNVILLKVYDTSPLFGDYKSDARFPELKIGLPFFIITDAKENLLYKTNDYTQTEYMMLFMGT